MTDVFSKKKRSRVMARIRAVHTQPELRIRSALHRAGYRFSLHSKKLPGKPDIVLRKHRTVIQVRGCFWHSHDCAEAHIPKTHRGYWAPKLRKNRLRDMRNDKRLRAAGWSVLAVWECRCNNKASLNAQVRRIRAFLGSKDA